MPASTRQPPLRPAPRGVLFDLDGVLIDSEQAWLEVMQRCREALGYGPLSRAEFVATFGQGIQADQAMFFPRHSVHEIDTLYAQTFLDVIDRVATLPDAQTVLASLRTRGLLLAVVTNSPRRLAEAILQRKQLAAPLHALAAAGEAPDKPAPDLLWLALERLGLQPREALYVGDSDCDRVAARAAGVTMAGFGIAADLELGSLRELLELLPTV